ncbi:MAG: hypothetical protein LBJ47_03765 [Tannerella sp.]|jgi:hypothetical protein|nr:hypothetical protein [Tannerella sp.]
MFIPSQKISIPSQKISIPLQKMFIPLQKISIRVVTVSIRVVESLRRRNARQRKQEPVRVYAESREAYYSYQSHYSPQDIHRFCMVKSPEEVFAGG